MFPYLFHAGHLYLPTYGALVALGLLLALGLSLRTAPLAGVDRDALWDAGMFAVMAAYGLSRLLLVLFHFSSFARFPWFLLMVPSVTPTGILLTLGAVWLWLWRRGIPVRRALDAWAPGACVVWAFVALGQFSEGSQPGMPSGRWPGLPMPGETTPLHPVALYTAIAATALAAACFGWLRRRPGAGESAALALVGAGGAQFLLSFLLQPGESVWHGLEPGQLLSLALVAAGGVLVATADRRAANSTH